MTGHERVLYQRLLKTRDGSLISPTSVEELRTLLPTLAVTAKADAQLLSKATGKYAISPTGSVKVL